MYHYQHRKVHQLIKKKKVKNNISINNPAPKLIDNKRKHLERQLRFVFAALPV